MSKVHAEGASWYVYVVRCANGALYTGIATNITRRIAEHRQGKGAKYLRGKGPLRLVLKKAVKDKGLAMRVESSIKKLSKIGKETLLKRRTLVDQIVVQAELRRTSGAPPAGGLQTRRMYKG